MAASEQPKSSGIAKGVLTVALVSLGLFGPLIGLKTEQNMDNQLILQFRPWHTLVAVAAAVVIYLIITAVRGAREKAAAAAPATPPVAKEASAFSKFLPKAGLAFIFLYPLIVIFLGGVSSVPKWVDNFGILILIYVMLGWGLNIVVGLAGLLDLGYVAFYAIGSYSYALLSLHFGWSFWLCLPVAGILAAFWGMMLVVLYKNYL